MVNKSVYYTTAVTPIGEQTDGVAVSSTTTFYSVPWYSDDGQSITVFATGTMTGTFTLWHTDVDTPVLTSDVDWVQDTAFAPTNPAGADVKFTDNTAVHKSRWKRLKYVNASGTGTVKAWMTQPGVTNL